MPMEMDYRHAALATNPEVWRTLDQSTRTATLQALENHQAQWSGRDARVVTPIDIARDTESHTYGYYDHFNHPDRLFLNVQDYDNVHETLDTLFHEGQHAYQHDCIDGKINIPEPIRQQFEEAFINYVPPELDPRAYANNFAERDARSEAQRSIVRLENYREVLQGLTHEIESYIPPIDETAENIDTKLAVAADEVAHDVIFKAGLTIPWSDEEDTHPEKVKTYGGRWRVTRASSDEGMSNDEKLGLCSNRLHTDCSGFSDNLQYMIAEDRMALRNDVEKEVFSYRGLQASYAAGDDEGFDLMYNSFLEDSRNFRDDFVERYYCGMNNGVVASKSNAADAEETQMRNEEDVSPTENANTAALRSIAVSDAWSREKGLVQNGQGTRDWTVEQQSELLSTGRVTGFEGSHMMSVDDYLEYAGNPDNIQFLPSAAHFEGVHQGDPRHVKPNGRFNENTGEVIPAVDGQIPKQPIVDLSDKYDPSQEEYHQSTPDMEQSGQRRHDDYYQSKGNHPEKSQKIGFRAVPDDSVQETISSTHQEDKPLEDANHAEKADQSMNAQAGHSSLSSTNTHEGATESKPREEAENAPEQSNDYGDHVSEPAAAAREDPKEQRHGELTQSNDAGSFWGNVPRSSTSSDDKSVNQEHSESNAISM